MSKTKEGKQLQDRMTVALGDILKEQLSSDLTQEQRLGNVARVIRAFFRMAARVAFDQKVLLLPQHWGMGAVEMVNEELEPEMTAHQQAAEIALSDHQKKMLN